MINTANAQEILRDKTTRIDMLSQFLCTLYIVGQIFQLITFLIWNSCILGLQLIQQKRLLMFSSRKHAQPQFSTKECQEMMKKEFCQFVNEHIINEDQEELIENYSVALEKDRIKQEIIKQKLNTGFFNKQKTRRNLKHDLRKTYTIINNQNLEMKTKLAEELRTSLTFNQSNRKTLSKTPQPHKNRYRQLDHGVSNFKRPCSNRLPFEQNCISSPVSKTSQVANYTIQIDSIIDESNKLNRKSLLKRRNIITSSERKSKAVKEDRTQKEEIINKIIENDVEEVLKSYSLRLNDFNPEIKRKIYQEKKRKQLKNFDKYNMSFTYYMKQKTQRNIENSIYNDKIRQKDSYVQKFQRYILDEFKFSEEAKRRLETIFKAIQLQYKRPVKNRQISERLMPKTK